MKKAVATLSVAALLGAAAFIAPSSGEAWWGGGGPFASDYRGWGGGYYPEYGAGHVPGAGGHYPGESGYYNERHGLSYYPDYEIGRYPDYGQEYYYDEGGYYPEYYWGGGYPGASGPATWMPWDLQN